MGLRPSTVTSLLVRRLTGGLDRVGGLEQVEGGFSLA